MADKKEVLADALEKINAINTNENNKERMRDFVYYLISQNVGHFAIMRHIRCLETLLEKVNDFNKKFGEINREEMQILAAKIKGSDNRSKKAEIVNKKLRELGYDGQETNRRILMSVKCFYKHLLGEDDFYPRQVAFIRTTRKQKDKKLPEDMLSEQEVIRLIDGALTLRDKTVIAVLWDVGLRCGELLNLKIRDIDLNGEIGHVQIQQGKTGSRRVPILFSASYLAQYLELRKHSSFDSPLFVSEGSWKYKEVIIGYGAIRKLIRTAGRRAKIIKKLNPHNFRHSRATSLASKLSDRLMMQYFGWSQAGTVGVYSHLSNKALDDSILTTYNKKPIERTIEITERVCQRCSMRCSVSSNNCHRCGANLNVAQIMLEEAKLNELREILKTNPELTAQIFDLVKKEQVR